MFVICTNVVGSDVIVDNEWKRFRVELNFNTYFRCQLKLKQLFLYSQILNVQEGLSVTLYNGYFNGTDIPDDPKLDWFDTAVVLNSGGLTTNLSNHTVASDGFFVGQNLISLKLSGYFYTKKTGVYRFVSRSDDASYVVLNGVIVVRNGGTHAPQNRFGNIYLFGGTYYKMEVYYGDFSHSEMLQVGFLPPQDDGSTTNSTNLGDFTFDATGLGIYWSLPFSTNSISLPKQIELRWLNRTESVRFEITTNDLFLPTKMIQSKSCEAMNIWLAEIYCQSKSLEMEYRLIGNDAILHPDVLQFVFEADV